MSLGPYEFLKAFLDLISVATNIWPIMKSVIRFSLCRISFLLFLGMAVLVPGLINAQTHYVYYLHSNDPLFDIQGPGVTEFGDTLAPGDGSFEGNVFFGSSNTLMYIDLNAVFQTTTNLLIGDIAGFTYYTKKNDIATTTNWSARIYTAPVPESAWYQYRFDAGQHNAPDTSWTLWNANDTGHFYNINDRSNGGNSNDEFSYTWDFVINNPTFASTELLYFAFLLPDAMVNKNHIALIEFTLSNGDVATLHLIPEPAHAAGILLSLLFAAIFYRRYLRTRKS